MLTASAGMILEITGGELVAGDIAVTANDLFVDSREVQPGSLFAALPGEQVDGHEFLSAALERGARVLLVSRFDASDAATAGVERAGAVIRVPDVLIAVQALAAWHRSRLRATVIGVTGSTGKTTTKDFLSAVLSTTLHVVATQGNRNNELGLPLTVFRAGTATDVLIVEMGMRGLGQIARLCEIARPDFGLVTNVGTSHIELLGTQQAVATAKGELVRAIPAEGAVFLNGDDSYSDALALDAKGPVVFYGLCSRCEVTARDIELDADSRASFTLVTPAGEVGVSLPLPGRHNVYNALAAAAVALRLVVPLERIAEGLGAAAVSEMRMQSFTTASGMTVINDAYNANPSSMRAALDTLAAMRVPGCRIAVLGDMAELGSLEELAHFQLGEEVAKAGIDALVTVGPRARRIADGARAEGMATDTIRPCATVEEAVEVLDDLLDEGDAVLVKASRVMGLEAVVEGIVVPRAR